MEAIYLVDSWDAVADMLLIETCAHMLENPTNKAAMRRIRWAVPFHRVGSQRTHYVTKPPPGPLSVIPSNGLAPAVGPLALLEAARRCSVRNTTVGRAGAAAQQWGCTVAGFSSGIFFVHVAISCLRI